ncbi:hypothetical protein IQ05_00779 [Flavobacterium tiangeerense]|uniref:DUF1129 domain-containing protein n=1 Tax=Flavobacterium tiangeerense TaxID=459471 RepID=A0ABY3FLY9_9FLAO|nr:hypothetical protein [Flavobacterium tiangeerense]TWI01208.1 hypothetical protein IQ05_00779 [Flavobacterium tiangeerense]
MKLTTEQIAQIEETLILNGVVYDDIKIELIDHIASEIETETINDSKPFETILKEVFQKWKLQLRPASHNLWLGNGFSAPKIIVDKLANDKKRELFAGAIIVSLVTVAILAINNKLQSPVLLLGVVFFMKILSLVGALLMLSGKLFLLQSRIKSTYLYRFNKSFYLILFYGVLIGIGLFPILPSNKNLEIKAISLIVTLIYLFLIFGNLKLFHKHFRLEKKLSFTKP